MTAIPLVTSTMPPVCEGDRATARRASDGAHEDVDGRLGLQWIDGLLTKCSAGAEDLVGRSRLEAEGEGEDRRGDESSHHGWSCWYGMEKVEGCCGSIPVQDERGILCLHARSGFRGDPRLTHGHGHGGISMPVPLAERMCT